MKYKIKYLNKNWKYYWINLLDNRGLYLNLNDFTYIEQTILLMIFISYRCVK